MPLKPMDFWPRFWSKVDKNGPNGCWIWTDALSKSGYAYIRSGSRTFPVCHRLSYEKMVGPIPSGMVLDHLCNNKACVNPSHLQPTTPKENVLRANSWSGRNHAKQFCPRGHPLSGDNLSLGQLRRGRRVCRTCFNAWQRNHRQPTGVWRDFWDSLPFELTAI